MRHLDDEVPIVATIFDPVTGRELEEIIDNCKIASLADIVAPSLAGRAWATTSRPSSTTASGRSGCAAATARST